MAKLTVSIVTPERSVIATNALQVTAPSVLGEVGILTDHKPLLANMEEGVVGIHEASGVDYFLVSGGFLEVSEDRVTVLAEAAEKASEVDIPRAEAALKDATAQLSHLPLDSDEHTEQLARTRRARNRLRAIKLTAH